MSTQTVQDTVTLERNGPIATLAFNRPSHMNSFDGKMAKDLSVITEALLHDSELRCLVIKGEGPLFMAGGDIKYFCDGLDTMPHGILDSVRLLNASILNLQQLDIPILAVVHGSVAGVGVSFLASADLAIAESQTKFTLAYSNIALSPDGGASYFLPRLVGQRKAMEMLLLPEVFGCEEALEYGLINWAVPAEELGQKAAALAQRLGHGPTAAYREIKQLARRSWSASLESQLEAEAQAFTRSTATHDFAQGVQAFLQKKRPKFKGC
jgi:2-(1,2-epoxy-1,2-dihydrophenyl)acetyl-CoA isomerase